MEIRRYQDIIAIKTPPEIAAGAPAYVGYHARNLEVAEISAEAFEEMTPITLNTGEIPALDTTTSSEALSALTEWAHEESLETRSGKIDFGIRSLTLNVTQICNLKCTYCAAGGDGTYGDPVAKISIEKTLPQLKFFIEHLKPGAKFNLSFVGGEPLLYPEAIKAIHDYVLTLTTEKQIQPTFMLTTNATLVTDDVLSLLKKMKIHITVSLDGDASINDKVRASKDGRSSTALTTHGLRQLATIRNEIASIGVSGVYSAENMDVIKAYDFFNSLQIDWMEFNFSYTEKSTAAQDEYLRQMSVIASKAWALGQEKELRKIKTFDHYFRLLDNQQKVENHCGAGKSYLMIDARNQLYTCPWVVGEKDEVVGMGSVLNNEKLQKYQKPLIELNNCQTCWARYLCGGGCMFIHRAHTGDKHKKNELFCERTRGLILVVLLYYKRSRTTASDVS